MTLPLEAFPPEAVDLAKKLKVLVQKEEWELLDGILDGLDCAFVEGTPEGRKQGWWVGIHVGFLNKVAPQMRERRSFRELISRYQAALDASPFRNLHLRAETVFGIAPLSPSVS